MHVRGQVRVNRPVRRGRIMAFLRAAQRGLDTSGHTVALDIGADLNYAGNKE